MVIVYVKHYLNPAGLSFFNTTWYPQVKHLIKEQIGFLSIRSHSDAADKECMHITVKFIDRETLDDWGATDFHAIALTQLNQYRTRAWNYALTEDEAARPDVLEWGEVPLD
jgi:hypothetical protein